MNELVTYNMKWKKSICSATAVHIMDIVYVTSWACLLTWSFLQRCLSKLDLLQIKIHAGVWISTAEKNTMEVTMTNLPTTAYSFYCQTESLYPYGIYKRVHRATNKSDRSAPNPDLKNPHFFAIVFSEKI